MGALFIGEIKTIIIYYWFYNLVDPIIALLPFWGSLAQGKILSLWNKKTTFN